MSEQARPDLPSAAACDQGCADGCCAAQPGASSTSAGATMGLDRRAVLSLRVRLLVAATITYNIIEAIVAITAGTVAGSTALIGFGWTR